MRKDALTMQLTMSSEAVGYVRLYMFVSQHLSSHRRLIHCPHLSRSACPSSPSWPAGIPALLRLDEDGSDLYEERDESSDDARILLFLLTKLRMSCCRE